MIFIDWQLFSSSEEASARPHLSGFLSTKDGRSHQPCTRSRRKIWEVITRYNVFRAAGSYDAAPGCHENSVDHATPNRG
jgi:hypothetical protein